MLKHKTDFKRSIAEKFLSTITVCPLDRPSAREAALLFENLNRSRKMINENDLLIAGISVANKDILLTRDKKFANLENVNIKIV